MALIKIGSLHEFTVKPQQKVLIQRPFLKGLTSFRALSEVTRLLEPKSFEVSSSTDKRGLALKSIELTEGFEGFLGNLFDKTNEVYFLAWTWDMSGQPVNKYPGDGVDPETVKFNLKVGNVREFVGDGIILFPKREVKGGIGVHIQLWESDKDIQNIGNVMVQVAETIQKSNLNNVLTAISLATGVSGVTITVVEQALLELTKLTGEILKANSPDFVDFFEGFYTTDKAWTIGKEQYKGNSSKIVLEKY